MTDLKVTREMLHKWEACYFEEGEGPHDSERVNALIPVEGLTPLEVCALDIPVADRQWVLLREEVIPAKELRLLACKWAEEACKVVGHNDPRSLEAIRVAREFAHGRASVAELDAAWAAAWAAARDAPREAARAAAWAAARDAAREAAWAAARDAARAAARDAARDAAWAAAWAAAWDDIRRVLEGAND